MSKIKHLPFYTFLDTLDKSISNEAKLPFQNIVLLGSRGCGKTDAIVIDTGNCSNLYNKDNKLIPVETICFRQHRIDIAETYNEYKQWLADMFPLIFPNDSALRITLPNNNRIRFYHTYKRSINGMESARCQYLRLIWEEAQEYKMQDFSNAMVAARPNPRLFPNAQILKIYIGNPYDPTTEFISFCIKHAPFNEGVLARYGYQATFVKNIEIGKDIVSKKPIYENWLFIYVNWRVIRDFLTTDQINSIIQAAKNNPLMAKTIDLGVPSTSPTDIYSQIIPKITNPVYYNHRYVCGGGDFGDGDSVGSGITAFCFVGYDPGSFCDVYAQWGWDHKRQFITPDEECIKVCKWYAQQKAIFEAKTNSKIDELIVYCDYSQDTNIRLLDAKAYALGYTWLKFTKCQKLGKNVIYNRVKIELYKGGRGELRMKDTALINDIEVIGGLKEEMKIAKKKEGKEENLNEFKRMKKDDHFLTCFEYAINDPSNLLTYDELQNMRFGLKHF